MSLIDSGGRMTYGPYMSWSEALSTEPDDAPNIAAGSNHTNPVQLCRKQLNMTLEQLSKATGVNLQAIHLLECGCYFPVLPRITQFFDSHSVIDPLELQEAYVNFQFHQRIAFGRAVGMHCLSDVGDWYSDPDAELTAPFEVFREEKLKTTRTGTAKGLCVQPAVLFRLANNESKSIPSLLSNALVEAGLSLDLLDELNERTRDYYSYR